MFVKKKKKKRHWHWTRPSECCSCNLQKQNDCKNSIRLKPSNPAACDQSSPLPTACYLQAAVLLPVVHGKEEDRGRKHSAHTAGSELQALSQCYHHHHHQVLQIIAAKRSTSVLNAKGTPRPVELLLTTCFYYIYIHCLLK